MKNLLYSRKISQQKNAGFTLIELLVVIIMVGILSVIAVPSWMSFVQQQRLNAAQNKALALVREAQANAKRDKIRWQACFWVDRTTPSKSQVLAVVQPQRQLAADGCANTTATAPIIDGDSDKITILNTSNLGQSQPQTTNITGTVYRVAFNSDGSVNRRTNNPGENGEMIAFSPSAGGSQRSCVMLETLLGAVSNRCRP